MPRRIVRTLGPLLMLILAMLLGPGAATATATPSGATNAVAAEGKTKSACNFKPTSDPKETRAQMVACMKEKMGNVGGGATGEKSPFPDWIKKPLRTTGKAAQVAGDHAPKAIKNTIDFAKDPFGHTAGKLQEAASGMTNKVLPAMVRATSPDFTAKWWLQAYAVSFGIGLAVWGLMLMRTFVDWSRRKIGSEDVLKSVTEDSPLFVVGAMFGPAVGGAVVKLFNELTVGLIGWGFGPSFQSMEGAVKSLDGVVRDAGPNSMTGGSGMAIPVYALFLLGLGLVLITLIVALVTMYMAGAVFPVGWAWLAHPETADRAMKVVRVILGLLCAKPMVFFFMAVALKMTASSLFGIDAPKDDDGTRTLVAMVSCGIAMLMVAFAPFMLPKMGQVGPTDASGASPRLRSPGGGGPSSSNGQLARMASSRGGGAAAAAAGGGGMAALGAGAGSLMSKLGGKSGDDQGGDTDTAGEGGGGGGRSTSPGDTGPDSGGGGVQSAATEAGQGDDSGSDSGASEQDRTDTGSDDGQGEDSEQGRLQNAASSSEGDSSGSGRDTETAAGSHDGPQDVGGSGQSGPGQSGSGRSKLAAMGSMAASGSKAAVNSVKGAGARGGALADLVEEQVDSEVQHQYKGPRAR